MAKAVIQVGGKQHLVSEGDTLLIDLVAPETKTVDVETLLVIDGDSVKVGQPTVKDAKVVTEIIEPQVKGDKIRVIRYKSKKRVHKEMGHRQKYTQIKIVSIK